MTVKIKKSTACGTVIAPPSKSMAHRLLICAGLSKGKSVIKNIAFSQDILATIDVLTALGAEINLKDGFAEVCGIDIANVKNGFCANCRESGSTLRFFIPILLLCDVKATLTGSEYLMSRPLELYREICQNQGIEFTVCRDRIHLCGKLQSGLYSLRGDVSSQFISGLLFALPLLERDSEIELLGRIESRSYIDMTIYALKSFGVDVVWKNENTLFVAGNQSYNSQELSVEGDYSNSAFLDAFSLIGGDVKVSGLNENSLQGDRVYKKYFEYLISDRPVLDISDCPDLAPILITVSAILNGAEFVGTKRLKLKESDRGTVMAQELQKFGADIRVFENNIIVNKTQLYTPNSTLYGHNDHRVVMSLSVILSIFGGEIDGAQAVNKSYPDFFDVISGLGIGVDFNET